LVLAFLLFRLIGDAVRVARRPRRSGQRPTPEDPKGDRERPYSDLTPYDIEDADYEDLPPREG